MQKWFTRIPKPDSPRLLSGAHHFFFEPREPGDLAWLRIVFYGLMLFFFADVNFSAFGEVPQELWQPFSLYEILGLPVLSSQHLGALSLVWKTFLFLSMLGLMTRLSTTGAFVLGWYLLHLQNGFGVHLYLNSFVILLLALFPFSRCGVTLSLDSQLFGKSPVSKNWHFQWPIRVAQVCLVGSFWGAGISKLYSLGLDFVFSDHVFHHAVYANYKYSYLTSAVTPHILEALSQVPWIFRVLAGWILVIELLSPLILFSRRAARWLIPNLLLFIVGVYYFMSIPFFKHLLGLLFFIPWKNLKDRWLPTEIHWKKVMAVLATAYAVGFVVWGSIPKSLAEKLISSPEQPARKGAWKSLFQPGAFIFSRTFPPENTSSTCLKVASVSGRSYRPVYPTDSDCTPPKFKVFSDKKSIAIERSLIQHHKSSQEHILRVSKKHFRSISRYFCTQFGGDEIHMRHELNMKDFVGNTPSYRKLILSRFHCGNQKFQRFRVKKIH